MDKGFRQQVLRQIYVTRDRPISSSFRILQSGEANYVVLWTSCFLCFAIVYQKEGALIFSKRALVRGSRSLHHMIEQNFANLRLTKMNRKFIYWRMHALRESEGDLEIK